MSWTSDEDVNPPDLGKARPKGTLLLPPEPGCELQCVTAVGK